MRKMLLLLALIASSYLLSAQNTISGTVKDAKTKEPLAGASINLKGTNQGTTTNNTGAFSIAIQKGDIVIIRYIGYAGQEIAADNQSSWDIELTPSSGNLQEITIVGSRRLGRTATETAVPIDVIDIKSIARQTGRFDVNNMLQFATPSFNANKQSGSDGADHIDPATIRGLGPDQTLVLINGKRRHQSSLINLFGTRGRGNTGTDLNAIPAAAIDRVEILRDGASAQYGSDAIAGVVNINLKSSVNEFTANINTGVYDAKKHRYDRNYDGESFQINGNYGTRIGEKGFVNFTADYLTNAKTNRVPPPGAVTYRREFGDASAESFSAFFNSEIPLSTNTSLYAFGGSSHRFTDAYAWSRDADDDRNVKEIYPNGFDPRIQSAIDDNSISVGVRTQHDGWNIDFNNTYGKNKMHYYVDGTLNATLLAKSPTHFDAGGFWFSQNTTGLNFSKPFDVAEGLNIAFGAEYRVDRYNIFAGEEGSWQNYGVIDTVINNRVVKYDKLLRPAGSQGFPGFQPRNEVTASRTNFGGYVDAELDVTKAFMISGAVRYEKYSDFGSTFNGKFATRIKIAQGFNLRGSISTGFRAPSLQQTYFNTIYTNFEQGVPIEILLANNLSTVTRTLGIPPLKEEKSVNVSAGFTSKPFKNVTLTVDGYLINVKDRIVLTGTFDQTDPDIGGDLAALNVGAANFFTNAIDSRNIGLDVILTHSGHVGNGRLSTTLAANFNKLTIEAIHTAPKLVGKEENYLSEREKSFIIASAPKSKINLTVDYTINRFSATARLMHYGEVTLLGYDDLPNVYGAKLATDLIIGYRFSRNVAMYVGADNVFNVYPDAQDQENTEEGGLWDSVQMNFGGRHYFARLSFTF
ncbi:TonB-dependent receptor [Paraflavitalea sp. CAU 1676]|uniref:TonB-dependent receptor n=1 Tax=Paraflavitalea sp. CAU 1676 TaxID=3032598 RepID=UPI0023DAB55E|nr:TonB-dependent receptor [Paraflavitalea sp. CAU 1676]MDF2192638.1 TonB-dependent receptor [Paraflavitalea sp. CAU 1676]